jgi:hypothetical protein
MYAFSRREWTPTSKFLSTLPVAGVCKSHCMQSFSPTRTQSPHSWEITIMNNKTVSLLIHHYHYAISISLSPKHHGEPISGVLQTKIPHSNWNLIMFNLVTLRAVKAQFLPIEVKSLKFYFTFMHHPPTDPP